MKIEFTIKGTLWKYHLLKTDKNHVISIAKKSCCFDELIDEISLEDFDNEFNLFITGIQLDSKIKLKYYGEDFKLNLNKLKIYPYSFELDLGENDAIIFISYGYEGIVGDLIFDTNIDDFDINNIILLNFDLSTYQEHQSIIWIPLYYKNTNKVDSFFNEQLPHIINKIKHKFKPSDIIPENTKKIKNSLKIAFNNIPDVQIGYFDYSDTDMEESLLDTFIVMGKDKQVLNDYTFNDIIINNPNLNERQKKLQNHHFQSFLPSSQSLIEEHKRLQNIDKELEQKLEKIEKQIEKLSNKLK